LWDYGWVTDANTPFSYNEHPRELVCGPDRTVFLSPLEGYDVPEIQIPGKTTRKVRSRVTYGHRYQCDGTPTVKLKRYQGADEVEFSLPPIGGYWGDVAANWSDLKDHMDGIGSATIMVYLKDFIWEGGNCGPYPGSDIPKGVIYRMEAYLYDDYNKK